MKLRKTLETLLLFLLLLLLLATTLMLVGTLTSLKEGLAIVARFPLETRKELKRVKSSARKKD